MIDIVYVPVIPFPLSHPVHCGYGYTTNTTALPHIIRCDRKKILSGAPDSVLGVEGFILDDVVVLPAALYSCEARARAMLELLITIRDIP